MATTTANNLLGRAATLHEQILTLDGHLDLPVELADSRLERDTGSLSRFDLAKVRRGRLSGGVVTVHATVVRPSSEAVEIGQHELETGYETIARLVAQAPDDFAIARTSEEFRALADAGKFAIVVGFQNAYPLGEDIDAIDVWAERGVRLFGFTFIGGNQWADSARPYPFIKSTRFGGLSELGVRAVARLNQLGVIIDASQLSSEAFADLLEHSQSPIVASHSGVRGLVDIGRNLSDGELAAVAEKRGVVQIVAFGHVRPPSNSMIAELEQVWRNYGLEVTGQLADLLSVNDPATADWDEEKFWAFLHEFHEVLDLDHPTATVSDFADSIDYAVERAGIEHVGIASDFNHGGGLADWHDVGESLNVTAELLRRGYSDGDVAKLWGENFLRVWSDVSRAART